MRLRRALPVMVRYRLLTIRCRPAQLTVLSSRDAAREIARPGGENVDEDVETGRPKGTVRVRRGWISSVDAALRVMYSKSGV